MIVSLRGTNGSGKSTVVREFMSKWPWAGLDVDKSGNPQNYEVSIPGKIPLLIIGKYVTQCGGCDTIQPYSEIWPRIVKYASQGHVLFEGVLVSSSYGSIGKASEVYGDKFVFAFLDTPLDICIERVLERRKKKGNDKEFNPSNLTQKWHSVMRSILTIEKLGRRVEMIPYKKAFESICKIYGVKV